MSLFNTQTFEIKTHTDGEYNDKGRWVDGTEGSPVYITGTAQPSSGLKVVTLLEGKRISGLMDLFTSSDLAVVDPDTLQGGSLVKINGEWWSIVEKGIWDNGIIPHYEYTVARQRELL